MNSQRTKLVTAVGLFCLGIMASSGYGVNLEFVGSQANLGNGEPGGGLPYVTAYWRTNTSNNIYSTGVGEYPGQFYGKAGYALFATTFTYPNANQIPGDAFLPTDGSDPLFPNMLNLPSWVADSQILAERMAGGFGYGLLDDPILMYDGTRQWTFDGVNYPLANGSNTTGQNPWVKFGILDGLDIFGNNPLNTPAGRWGFTVGPDTPSAFRVGVFAGGDTGNGLFSPSEIFLQQFDTSGAVPAPIGDPVTTGALTAGTVYRDKIVDMHFFDIVGAEEGDTFVFAVTASSGSFGNSGIAGFSFDLLPDVGVMDADFNGDGDIDGADFLIWQRGFGTGTTLSQGDANDDGNVNGADLAIWQDQYGSSPLISAVSVPEPNAMLLLLISVGLSCATRR